MHKCCWKTAFEKKTAETQMSWHFNFKKVKNRIQVDAKFMSSFWVVHLLECDVKSHFNAVNFKNFDSFKMATDEFWRKKPAWNPIAIKNRSHSSNFLNWAKTPKSSTLFSIYFTISGTTNGSFVELEKTANKFFNRFDVFFCRWSLSPINSSLCAQIPMKT